MAKSIAWLGWLHLQNRFAIVRHYFGPLDHVMVVRNLGPKKTIGTVAFARLWRRPKHLPLGKRVYLVDSVDHLLK